MGALLLLLSVLLPGERQQDPGISSSIKTLYVVEMSHTDVGFTDPPSEVARLSYEHLVHALDLADSYPEFHWTIETSWQLQSFLEQASAGEIARLRQRFGEGRFRLSGSYVNPHSGLWGEEELHRFVHPSARMARDFGTDVRSAILDDVPGFSLAMPRILSQSGVEFLLLGANDFVGGKPDIPLADRPFWWRGRDGSRVLTWLTYGSYVEGFVEWGLLNMQTAYPKIRDRLQEFESAGYPYDAVLVMRGFDNADVSSGMADLARQWNATYQNPKIVLATPEQFFDHLLQSYGDVFPTYSGDAAGMWESVSATTPATQSMVRRARARLAAVESLWTWLAAEGKASYPTDRLQQAWEKIMVFDEHSGGGMPWPGLLTEAEANQHNLEYVDLAVSSAKAVLLLQQEALDKVGPAAVPAGEVGLLFVNPLGDSFRGVVEVECPGSQPPDLRLIDPDGGPDPVFRWLNSDRSALALEVDLPARGFRRFQIGSGGQAPPPPSENPGDRIQMGDLELKVDPATGVGLALTELSSGFAWLDPQQEHQFGGFEQATNQKAFFSLWSSVDPEQVKILVEDPGPVFRRLRVLDKRDRLLREYRLYEYERRVDLVVELHTSDLPFVEPELHSFHYMVSFPSTLQAPTRLIVDGPDGFYEPGLESLPGAALGHFAAATGAILFGDNGRWMQMTSPDSAMLDLGEMTEAPAAQVEKEETGLGWKLRRHASLGEVSGGSLVPIEAEPGVADRVRYAFQLRFGQVGDPSPGREVFRHDISPPLSLWVEQGQGVFSPSSGTWFDLQGPAQVIAVKQREDEQGILFRLRGAAPGGQIRLRLPWNLSRAWEVDLLERVLSPLVVQNGWVQFQLAENQVFSLSCTD
ncbi:MAG: hypothetical protein DWQ01_22395 [Planctomycetota bacterium]|nr:MAG: hypothetical protein DWQ01_22395 [Planctomycetota bacterium]